MTDAETNAKKAEDLLEGWWQDVLAGIKSSKQAMEKLMALSEAHAEKHLVEMAYTQLEEDTRHFAKYYVGVRSLQQRKSKK